MVTVGPRDDNLGVSNICGQFVASISELAIGPAAASMCCWGFWAGSTLAAVRSQPPRLSASESLVCVVWAGALPAPGSYRPSEGSPGKVRHLADFRTFLQTPNGYPKPGTQYRTYSSNIIRYFIIQVRYILYSTAVPTVPTTAQYGTVSAAQYSYSYCTLHSTTVLRCSTRTAQCDSRTDFRGDTNICT